MAYTERDYATFLLKKNCADIVWSALAVFENCSVTLAATKTIIEGFSVSGITLNELTQVKNLGMGIEHLAELLISNQFAFTNDVACHLHNIIERDRTLTKRKYALSINNSPSTLSATKKPEKQWITAQKKIQDIIKSGDSMRASAEAFCQMVQSQFFTVNGRCTSWLMSLGILVDAGIPPYALDVRDKECFNITLTGMCRTENSENMINLLYKHAGYTPKTGHHEQLF